MRRKPFLRLAFVAALAFSSAEGFGGTSFKGYFKSFLLGFRLPAAYTESGAFPDRDLLALNNRLRLELLAKPDRRVDFSIAADFSLRFQNSVLSRQKLFFSGISPETYRLVDFSNRLYPGPESAVRNFAVFLNLDRLAVAFHPRWADIFVGRQAIAWGSARIINPTDVIAPFTFNELDKEERFGVDAVRVRAPLGAMDELDLGFVAGKDLERSKNAAFVRGKTYLWTTDLSLLFLGFREHGLFGIDLARSIGGAGFWLESAYVVPYLFNASRRGEADPYFRISTGLDYNFSPRLYGYGEYHFDSAGKAQPRDYASLFNSVAFRDGTVYLLGRHYLGGALVYQFTPLLPGTFFFLFNLGDGSFIFAPQLDYNAAENIYLSAGSYLGFGKSPSAIPGRPGEPGVSLRSEFGSYPDMLFVSFRVYF
jgi:hypothetical protein